MKLRTDFNLSRAVALPVLLLVICAQGIQRVSAQDEGKTFPKNRNPFAPRSIHHGPAGYASPEGLAENAAFIDRILPFPAGKVRADVWGTEMTGPRSVDNGFEDPAWSYWCCSVHYNPTMKKYEMLAAGWPEDSEKGHMSWPASMAVYATSDTACGPYKKVGETIGRAHNVWLYRAQDGRWVQYGIGASRIAEKIAGPWKRFGIRYQFRDLKSGPMSNQTFTRREDGSILMLNRGGRTWISEDGIKPFRLVSPHCPYPGFPGAYEDPCVWRDEVQYNLIVNDWYGRQAYYLRSIDGVNWVLDEGLAYTPHVVKHEEGGQEKWFKLERPAVMQDQFGRATHFMAAAIDTLKLLDKKSDEHSSKVLVLPLRVPRRMEILTGPLDEPLKLCLKAEKEFDPVNDVDIESIRFGAPRSVDFGGGAKPIEKAAEGRNLILTFPRNKVVFEPGAFVAKLLGKTKKGEPLFGFARIPGVNFQPALVSLDGLKIENNQLIIGVENFGLKASVEKPLRLYLVGNKNRQIQAKAFLVPSLKPYQRHEIRFDLNEAWLKPKHNLVAELPENGDLSSKVELLIPQQK
jgi:hypothetical protein